MSPKVEAHLGENMNSIDTFLKVAEGEEGEEETSGGSGVSSSWMRWLNEVHDKGMEKVPNPNSATRSRFPQVSYSTALKDKSFKSKAVAEYSKWLENSSKDEKKDEPSKKETPKKDTGSSTKPDSRRIDALIEEHGEQFDEIMTSMKAAVKKFKAQRSKPRSALDQSHKRFKKAFARLSPEEQAIMAAGSQLGDYFQKHMKKKDAKMREVGKGAEDSWRLTADMSRGESVQNLIGVAESWGVKGSRLPQEDEEKIKKYREEGAKNEELKKYAKESYEFTQAFFKRMGIKEVTLFRGVRGQGVDEAKKDTEVELTTRSLSSYSLNASTAGSFGKVVEFKVPVQDIFTSSLTSPEFSNEFEFVVMGGPKKGKVI